MNRDVAGRLQLATPRLLHRLDVLEQRLDAGDETAWPSYCEAINAYASVVRSTAPATPRDQLLTTRQLADTFGVSSKTILRKKKAGILIPAKILGKRGRGALRWAAPS